MTPCGLDLDRVDFGARSVIRLAFELRSVFLSAPSTTLVQSPIHSTSKVYRQRNIVVQAERYLTGHLLLRIFQQ